MRWGRMRWGMMRWGMTRWGMTRYEMKIEYEEFLREYHNDS